MSQRGNRNIWGKPRRSKRPCALCMQAWRWMRLVLFELRMLREPSADPNVEWTQITNRYLHIVPHPDWPGGPCEYNWWTRPGYMVNYGLGRFDGGDAAANSRHSGAV